MILGIVRNKVYYTDIVMFGSTIEERTVKSIELKKNDILKVKSSFGAKVYSSKLYIKLLTDMDYRNKIRKEIIDKHKAMPELSHFHIQTNDDAELMCKLLLR